MVYGRCSEAGRELLEVELNVRQGQGIEVRREMKRTYALIKPRMSPTVCVRFIRDTNLYTSTNSDTQSTDHQPPAHSE